MFWMIISNILLIIISDAIMVYNRHNMNTILYENKLKADQKELQEVYDNSSLVKYFFKFKIEYIPILNVISALLIGVKVRRDLLKKEEYVSLTQRINKNDEAYIENIKNEIIKKIPFKFLRKLLLEETLNNLAIADEKELAKEIATIQKEDVIASKIDLKWSLQAIENLAIELNAIVNVGKVDDENVAVITSFHDTTFTQLFPEFEKMDKRTITDETFTLYTTRELDLRTYDVWKHNTIYDLKNEFIVDEEVRELKKEL